MVITSYIRICQVVITSDIQKQLNVYFLNNFWCSFLMDDTTIISILVSKQSKIYARHTKLNAWYVPRRYDIKDTCLRIIYEIRITTLTCSEEDQELNKTKFLSYYSVYQRVYRRIYCVVEPSFIITWCTVGLFTTSCGRGKVQLCAHSKCF